MGFLLHIFVVCFLVLHVSQIEISENISTNIYSKIWKLVSFHVERGKNLFNNKNGREIFK